MHTYKVSYEGNATKFKGFESTVNAKSEREAVESVYQRVLDADYFPQDDGSIWDCDGNVIAEAGDTQIEYDGGYFTAELLEETEAK